MNNWFRSFWESLFSSKPAQLENRPDVHAEPKTAANELWRKGNEALDKAGNMGACSRETYDQHVKHRTELASYAVRCYTEAISLCPREAKYYQDRARAFEVFLQKNEEALQDYSTLIAISPTPENYCRRANFYCHWYLPPGGNRYDKAIEDYTTAIQIDPTRADIHRDRAHCYQWLKNLASAVEDYNAAIRLAPDSPGYFCSRADCFLNFGLIESALLDYSKALELVGNEDRHRLPSILSDRSKVYAAAGWFEEAIDDLTRASELSNGPWYLYDRGRLYERLGKYAEAIKDYNESLRHDFGAGLLLHLAWIFATCPDPTFFNPREALRLIGPLPEEEGSSSVGWRSYACAAAAHAQLGDFVKAVAYQKKVFQKTEPCFSIHDPASPFHESLVASYDAKKAYRDSDHGGLDRDSVQWPRPRPNALGSKQEEPPSDSANLLLAQMEAEIETVRQSPNKEPHLIEEQIEYIKEQYLRKQKETVDENKTSNDAVPR